jgi:predicted metal-binding protein
MESLLALLPAGIQASAYQGTLASQAAHAALAAPDVLVADLGDGPAPDALLPLQACAGVPVLALSTRQDAEFLLAAMRAGVREVLPLSPDGQHLRAALERVAGMRRVQRDARGKLLAFVSCKGGSGATSPPIWLMRWRRRAAARRCWISTCSLAMPCCSCPTAPRCARWPTWRARMSGWMRPSWRPA